ncbi:unnamed protein product [Pleuronectes platessa]|uniref:Uncharacterized protein n=1 Tax=Pleuronectes platessa TaxID=8262 RepID=A0A9N7ZE44_PLEPL|nr:unnamed protein product [Pleuronectes platessa]
MYEIIASRPDLAASRGRGLGTRCALCFLPRFGGVWRGTGSLCPRRDCRPGRTVLSAPQPRRVAQGGERPSQRARYETPWRNESEGRRAPAEVGSRPPGAPGAPPARLARTVGEVERERVR